MKEEMVRIVWLDAALHGQDTKFDDSDFELIELHSVGFVAKETDTYITLAMDCTPRFKTWRSTSSIPKSGIQRIEYLRKR